MDSRINRKIEAGHLSGISVRGGVYTAVAQGLKFLVRIASQITIARLLLPADYGLVAMIAPVLAFLMLITELGMGQAVVQFPDITHKQVSGLFWLGLAMNSAVALAICLCAPLIAMAYHEPRLVMVTIATAALLPISGTCTQHFALLIRNLRFKALAVLDVAPAFVGLLAGLAAAFAHWGYWALIVAQAGEAFAQVAIAWAASGWRPSRPAYDRNLRSVLRVGAHITGSNLATYITTSVDNVILGLTGGSVVLGLYDKGYRTVTQPASQLMAPFNRVAVPTLLRLVKEDERYRASFISMLELIMLLLIPGVIVTAILAGPLFLYLLGPNWRGIEPIVTWLCIGALASPIYSATTWLFTSQGRTGEQLRYSFLVAGVSVVGFVAGLPWGAAGVAAGAAMSFVLVATPVASFGATRRGPVNGRALVTAILPFAAIGAVLAAATLLLKPFDRLHGLALLVAFPAAYGAFFALLACLPTGRKIIGGIWRIKSALTPEKLVERPEELVEPVTPV